MMRSRRPTQGAAQRAALFVDYANLHALLAERLDDPAHAGEHIAEALDELRRRLANENRTDTVLTAAYADFGALESGENLQQQLYQQGVETRFVPTSEREHAAEVQLSIDATALTHRRPSVGTVVLVAGARSFLPLLRTLRRQGTRVLVAVLDPPAHHAQSEDDAFIDFLDLLSDAARRTLLQGGDMPARPDAHEEAVRPSPRYDRLDDEMLFRTLEITDEHFGQYEEVYLTPLLRKLSDVLGERFDPKALVSDLEEAGAVHLEKRRGYPYDYTVLIVNRDHPDVQEMESDAYDEAVRYEDDHGSEEGYSEYEDEYDDYESSDARSIGGLDESDMPAEMNDERD